MIDFNTHEGADKRTKTKKLSLVEEYNVIEILNKRIQAGTFKKISRADENLLQRFVNHYQNLCHFAAVNSGLSSKKK